jgi:hypothetical protein
MGPSWRPLSRCTRSRTARGLWRRSAWHDPCVPSVPGAHAAAICVGVVENGVALYGPNLGQCVSAEVALGVEKSDTRMSCGATMPEKLISDGREKDVSLFLRL